MPLTEQPLAAGEPWYASGTFWAIAAVVVAVVAIVVGAWAAFRSARPRRVLYVWVDSAVPLMNTARGLHGRRLAVTLDDQELTAPYVVAAEVVSRGALDIAASAFGGRPLELEFGAPVLGLLEWQADAGRAAVRPPEVEIIGTALHLGPSLLTRRHRLRYTVLLDGKPDFCPVGDLVDVTVRQERAPQALTIVRVVAGLSSLAALIALLVLAKVKGDDSPLTGVVALSVLALTAIDLAVGAVMRARYLSTRPLRRNAANGQRHRSVR
ncbi:hypothetical protein Q5530_05545 [Saccharothrix sp. BKS2]|uniref:hypothetical protein n=1 Tax=Saccharothrix sp. BKS2 TaxID=3064400 RepID=UPI0039E98683